MGEPTYRTVGIIPPDERWESMKRLYDACKDADVSIPKKVNSYFNYRNPNENGVEVNIPHTKKNGVEKYILEVDVDKIPNGVKKIQFIVSY